MNDRSWSIRQVYRAYALFAKIRPAICILMTFVCYLSLPTVVSINGFRIDTWPANKVHCNSNNSSSAKRFLKTITRGHAVGLVRNIVQFTTGMWPLHYDATLTSLNKPLIFQN